MSKLHPSQIYQDFWGENPGISIFKVLEVIPMRGQVCGRPGDRGKPRFQLSKLEMHF